MVQMRDERLAKKTKQGKTEAQKMVYVAKTTSSVLNNAKPCSNLPVKRISWEEMPKCSEKGLCFSCNEKYTPGHRCLTPQICVIEHSRRTVPIKNQKRIWTRSTPRFLYMHCQGGQDQKLRIVTIMAKAYSAKPMKFECVD